MTDEQYIAKLEDELNRRGLVILDDIYTRFMLERGGSSYYCIKCWLKDDAWDSSGKGFYTAPSVTDLAILQPICKSIFGEEMIRMDYPECLDDMPSGIDDLLEDEWNIPCYQYHLQQLCLLPADKPMEYVRYLIDHLS